MSAPGYGTDTQANVLIVEDTHDVREALAMLVRGLGYKTTCAATPQEALDNVGREEFELVLLDLNYRRDTTSGAEGLQFLSLLRARAIDTPVIAMTAWGSIDVAVEAMHKGACDFMQKPWDNSQLERLVKTYVAKGREEKASRQRRQLEWDHAVAVQRRLLPREMPTIEGLSVAAFSRPAGPIGGDYYDVFSMRDKLAIVIGDVVGKGIPAALMMSNLQAAVKVTATDWVSPAELCQRVNQLACSNGESEILISFFFGVIEPATRTLTYCNCGHNAPVLLKPDSEALRLQAGGTLIGFRSAERYTEDSVALGSGDRLLLYTDGLSEAEDGNAESYGEDRIVKSLRSAPRASAHDLLGCIVEQAALHCGGAFSDDVTAVLVCAV